MERIEVKFEADSVDRTGEFAGYGAVFGNIDSHGDVIAPGAFQESLSEWKARGKLPPMLLQHGGWQMVDTDAIPVGKWTKMAEDEIGLRVEGKLINLDTEVGKRVYGAMREGVLDGMSIGFRPKKFSRRTKPEEPRRTLEVLDLVELSIVTFPANGKARVVDVKSGLSFLSHEEVRELEAVLRDEGLSRSHAMKAIAGFKSYFQGDPGIADLSPRDEVDAGIAAALGRYVEILEAR